MRRRSEKTSWEEIFKAERARKIVKCKYELESGVRDSQISIGVNHNNHSLVIKVLFDINLGL